jgi:hypothetical protein
LNGRPDKAFRPSENATAHPYLLDLHASLGFVLSQRSSRSNHARESSGGRFAHSIPDFTQVAIGALYCNLALPTSV